MEMSYQLHASAALLSQEKPPDKKFGEAQSRSGRCIEDKNLSSAWDRIPAVQPVASRYTD
jgi:hypothetical protein